MKLNISYPANGSQKLFEIDDDRKLRVFMERRMGAEVPGDSVGDEWKGYVFKITGGNDKQASDIMRLKSVQNNTNIPQGFPMKQGVMSPARVRLLLSEGHSCYRPRRTGERKRKSVRGCIVGMDLSVLALSIVKQGEGEIPGLTDTVHPKRLGPKRATKIRRFFGLSKEDDVILPSPIPYCIESELKFIGSQIRDPSRSSAQEGGCEGVHQGTSHSTPRYSSASPAQAPQDRNQAPPRRGLQGRCRK